MQVLFVMKAGGACIFFRCVFVGDEVRCGDGARAGGRGLTAVVLRCEVR